MAAQPDKNTLSVADAMAASAAELALLADLGLAMHRMNLLAFGKFHVRADAR